MKKEFFDLSNFKVIQDEEYYYFFRALNNGDNSDITQGITTEESKIKRIRTDRERYKRTAKYTADSKISLEEMHDHIKMGHRTDTNCISLTTNANVAIDYGRRFYNDEYVIIRVPIKDFGENIVNAGSYMLAETEKKILEIAETLPEDSEVLKLFEEIDSASSKQELEGYLTEKFTSKKLEPSKAKIKGGITYRNPAIRISSYDALSEDAILEKNKLVAKIKILERYKLLKNIVPHVKNTNLMKTIGNAFSSTEVIHYNDIEKDEILDVPKEVVYVFSLLQQLDIEDKSLLQDLTNEILQSIQNNQEIPKLNELNYTLNSNISMEEMYKLTSGRVNYAKSKSIIEKTYYLSLAKLKANNIAEILRNIVGNSAKYESIIKQIEEKTFEIEPEIITRKSGKGQKISESVNLIVSEEERIILEKVQNLKREDLQRILENGGISPEILEEYYNEKEIEEDYYIASTKFANYDWKSLGVEEFSAEQEKALIQLIVENSNLLNEELTLSKLENMLGYYELEGTELVLKDYQYSAVENIEKILENNRYAACVLPTGAGKTFVALAEMLKHKDEKILYLAPTDIILQQVKDYIVTYIHGTKGTLGKMSDEEMDKIIKEIFPNLTLETYPGLTAIRGRNIIKQKYDRVFVDEEHRTGADTYEEALDKLIANQDESCKFIGITATPQRDSDNRHMVDEFAEKLGYTQEEIASQGHVAMEMDIIDAIKMGIVVNPKIVYCEYMLKLDGTLASLNEKIASLDDGDKKEELQQKFNELSKNIDKSASGIGEILRSNLKPGGRYIVFVPVNDNSLQDLDDKVENKNLSRQKIKNNEKFLKESLGEEYINELKQAGINIEFKYMLGNEGKKFNEKQLEEFENSSENTITFMQVINMLNEGKHAKGVTGIVWQRALDENSVNLALQQFGRGIFALDENNPITDEERPIIFDFACNLLRVNFAKKLTTNTPRDDLKLLKQAIAWYNEHGRIIPDINSKNRNEASLASILKRIQAKYQKYFDEEMLEDLSDDEKIKIQTILEYCDEIDDFWEYEFPEKMKVDKKENNEFDAFEIKGVLKDFVELEEMIQKEENLTAIEKLLRLLEELDNYGVDIKKMPKYYGGKKTLLINIKYIDKQGKEIVVNIKDIIEKFKLKPNYNLGGIIAGALEACKGRGTYAIENEKVKKLISYGLITQEEIDFVKSGEKKKSSVAILLEVLEALEDQSVDIKSLLRSGKKLLTDIKYIDKQGKEIEINKNYIIEKLRLKKDYKLGTQIQLALMACRGKGNLKIIDEEVKKLIAYGLITQQEIDFAKSEEKKKSSVAILLEVLKELEKQGVDIKLLPRNGSSSKNVLLSNIKYKDKYGKEIEVNTNEIIEKLGLNSNYNLGTQIQRAIQACKGKSACKIELEEINKLITYGLITQKEIDFTKSGEKKKSAIAILLEVLKELENQGVDIQQLPRRGNCEKTLLTNIKYKDKQGKEIEVNTSDIIEKFDLKTNYNLGLQILGARQACRGRGNFKIEQEEINELIAYDLITQEEIDFAKSGETKKSSVAILLEVLKELENQGVNIKLLPKSGQCKTLLTNIKYKDKQGKEIEVDTSDIIEKLRLKKDYNLGSQIQIALMGCRGSAKIKITDEEVDKLIAHSLITQEEIDFAKSGEKKKSDIAILLEVLKELENQGIDIQQLPRSGNCEKTLLANIKYKDNRGQEIEVNAIKIIEKFGLKEDYNLGSQILNALQACKGRANYRIEKEEIAELIAYGLITQEELDKVKALNFAKKQRNEAKKKNQATHDLEARIDENLEKQGEEAKVDE